MSGAPSFEWGVHVLRPVAPAEAQAMRRAGFSRVTITVPWRWLAPNREGFSTSALDWFLRPLRAASLPLQAALGPAMPHLLPEWMNKEGGADAERFIERFAQSCAVAAAAVPDIAVLRVEAELNGAALWERLATRRRRGRSFADPGFRSALLVACVDAVRRARPDAALRTTVHAGLPGWRAELRRWLAAGLRVERVGLTLQPCFFLPDPELARRVGEAVGEARSTLPPGVEVEVARLGYPTRGARFTPRRQREFLVLAAAEARAAGARGLHWWSLRDQAHDDPSLGYFSPAQERDYGLQYYDGTPKPAADEFAVLATGSRFSAQEVS